ncbi:MAG: hypothetical protein K2M06_03555 [Muribaculaceae bacterium]|nr:hypothetical protein [Muribaculaceae bacterium]
MNKTLFHNSGLRLYFLKLTAFIFILASLSVEISAQKYSNDGYRHSFFVSKYEWESTVELFPDEFCGYTTRLKFVHAPENNTLSKMLDLIDNTDISTVSDDTAHPSFFYEIFVYDKPVVMLYPAISPILVEQPTDTVGPLDKGFKEVYIEVQPSMDIDAKYKFVYDDKLMFSRQWIDGLFGKEITAQTLISQPKLLPHAVLWKFTLIDGTIKQCEVLVEDMSRPAICIYDVLNKSIRKIDMPRR